MKQVNLRLVRDEDFYQSLRRRVRERTGRGGKYADLALFLPDLVHLFVRLIGDRRVPFKSKVKIGAALAYFLSPIDLVPEALLGPVGYLDDLALAAWVLDDLFKSAGPGIALEHWAGSASLLDLMARASAAGNELLGSGAAKRLKTVFDRQRFGGSRQPDERSGV